MLIVGSFGVLKSGSATGVTNGGTSSAEDQTANTSTSFDSLSFDRMLEAASSGGMSDNLRSESDGVPQNDRNGTVHSNTNSTGESAGKAALAEALARHKITAIPESAEKGSHHEAVSSD